MRRATPATSCGVPSGGREVGALPAHAAAPPVPPPGIEIARISPGCTEDAIPIRAPPEA